MITLAITVVHAKPDVDPGPMFVVIALAIGLVYCFGLAVKG